jgi:hypothetical protein
VKLKPPAHKGDWEAAKAIASSDWSEVSHLMPELLDWTQDGNWPVAKELLPFFAAHGREIVEEVRAILVGQRLGDGAPPGRPDWEWIWFLLEDVVPHWPESVVRSIEPELRAMPTTGVYAEIGEMAARILARLDTSQ